MNKTLVMLALALTIPTGFADPAPDFTALVAKTKDAVVSIEVESRVKEPTTFNGLPPEVFEDFFGLPAPFGALPFEQDAPRERVLEGQGSGFIIDSDGYILTNAHVVEGADKVRVQLNNNKEYSAEVIGLDKRTDIALVKIQGEHLPVAKLGDSDQVQVGDWVLAIGSPFGFTHTATKGIVSAVARNLPRGDYVPFIQTDAAVNPGNSGGPLFNSKGEVIAINSQIYSRSGGFMGISFAIPIDVAMNVADQIKKTGKVQRGQLGVIIQEVSYDLAKSFGLDKAGGALVAKIMPNSPAAQAGLQVGDIVRSVNGEEVRASSDLPVMVGAIAPGKEVRLGVWRKGEEIFVKVQLGSVGASVETGSSGSSNPAKQPDAAGFTVENTGLTLQVRNSDNKQHLIVTRVTGAAERAGLKRGDEILAVSQITVDDESTFRSALENAGKNVPLLVQRDGNTLFLALNLQ